jgi:competence protein ComEC
MIRAFALMVSCSLFACGGSTPPPQAAPLSPVHEATLEAEPGPGAAAESPALASPAATHASAASTCGGAPLTVHFFDVGQGLSVLVKLPDGRNLLVDAGEDPNRPFCGAPCKDWDQRLLAALPAALGTSKLDALWITHQHSDHLGGVPSVLKGLSLGVYVDNGLDLKKKQIVNARAAAQASGAQILVESPGNATPPLPASSEVKLTPVLPATWPEDCSSNPNECSIALRIDYCKSSILFTGDAEVGLEGLLDPGDVDLLQVGHHASATSSTAAFLGKTKPNYAVISSGKPDEGTNGGFCHPREVTVAALTTAMGGPGSKTIKSFDSNDGNVKCGRNKPANWVEAPANDNLWSTARDGDVVLVTKGDGSFERVSGSDSSAQPGPSGSACCKTCTNSKPCGDACVPKANACNKAPGCACSSP